ncbi:hypothetical protein [Psychrosphaera aestuarii]|uniref:hypothetical protein n=1 Tax=Psychrosphaera aestuarii TaxID=1266052 RepID=UPI001B31B47C|nr:hypothetical protein [Psychrosphaera aestuarii]
MNSQYMKPAIATLMLALIFPIYWSTAFYSASFNNDIFAFIKADMMTLSLTDLMFVTMGALEVYVYLSLAKALKSQLTSRFAPILLVVMAIASGLFHGTVLFDITLSMTNGVFSNSLTDNIVATGLFLGVCALVLLAFATFICSIVILVNHQQISSMLKVFAALLLVVSVLQVTVIFSAFNLLLFPFTLALLALYFVKEPDTLEVV